MDQHFPIKPGQPIEMALVILDFLPNSLIRAKNRIVKNGTIEMGELCSVILLLLLMLFYVYRIYILFSGHYNDYFLKISFVKLLVVTYVSYLYGNIFLMWTQLLMYLGKVHLM